MGPETMPQMFRLTARIPVGLFEQGEREVEFGLGEALAEVEVDAIGHVLALERTGPFGEGKADELPRVSHDGTPVPHAARRYMRRVRLVRSISATSDANSPRAVASAWCRSR